jgi:RNA polymerase sigma factor (sigma-70 family)
MSKQLDQIFREHHQELRGFAFNRLGCPEEAADIVQDAFVRYASMEQKAKPTIVETPRFFLSRIVSNLIIDKLRIKSRRGTHSSLDDIGHDIVDPQPLPDHILDSRQQFYILTSALNELSEKCRTALLLNRIEGHTHQEIATHMGISPSMVCKYIMQAIKHCAIRLNMTK